MFIANISNASTRNNFPDVGRPKCWS